jgi:pectate lyase
LKISVNNMIGFKKTVFIIVVLLVVSLFASPMVHALPALPGAEGFGTDTVGGRGGTVYIVSNLNDSGSGSLRGALLASGPRIIVFRVSGTIHLTSILEVYNPYITIAGQTSPGGINISGGTIRIRTHDVIITHVRFRLGSDICDQGNQTNGTNCDQAGDTLQVAGVTDYPAYNVIIDHCSFSWGADETLDVSSWYDDTYNVTVSNSLVAQGLDIEPNIEHHALGFLISGHYNTGVRGHREITITAHHNYLAHFQYRFPQISAAYVDWYNNVSYDYDSATTWIDRDEAVYPDSLLNSRSNYYKQGPSTAVSNNCTNAPNKSIGLIWEYAGDNYAMTGTPYPMVHSSGNIGCAGIGDTTGKIASGYWGNDWPFLAPGWISEAPIAAATNGDAAVTTMSTDYAATVVANAGANRIADSGVPSTVRDSLDTQLIADYSANTGSWLTAPDEDRHFPTNWPTYSTANDNPTDTDSDGMWDTTEAIVFGDLSKTAMADADGDGYANIEEYLHYLGGYSSEQPDLTAPASPGGLSVR